MNSTNGLLRLIAGSAAQPGDSDLALLKRVAAAEGVATRPSDSFNDVLRRMAVSRGVSPVPGDSDNWLLRRLVGARALPGDSNWDLLKAWSDMHRADGGWTADSTTWTADEI